MIPRRAISSGDRFGRLEVIETMRKPNGRPAFRCKCDCGGEQLAMYSQLIGGYTTSCGCARIDRAIALGRARKLPAKHTPTYLTWRGMIARCNNPKATGYKNYGGRGIKVCGRWKIFENFLADMGERPEGLTLDRENSDENYEPGNCRWATEQEQRANMRRTRLITFNGTTQTLSQWARKTGVCRATIVNRLQSGMTSGAALGLI